MRRPLVPALLVLAGVLVVIGGLSVWLHRTVYDSDVFARRVTAVLDSSAVRREAADELTAELVRAGDQQAISFRPAFEAAIESALDTDTFRTLFRNAVRTAHADLLRGGSGSAGVDLSDSLSIVVGTLELSSPAGPGGQGRPSGLASAFSNVSTRLGDLAVWHLDETIEGIAAGCFVASAVCVFGALVLTGNRRRTMWWLGWTVASGGLVVVALLWIAGWYVDRQVDDHELGAALRGAVGGMTADLRTLALWTIAYGVILSGAAATADRAYTPSAVLDRGGRWIRRRRRTTTGRVVVGAVAIAAGFVVIANTQAVATVLVAAGGLWLTYVGTVELIAQVRRVTTAPARAAWWRPLLVVAVVGVALVALTAGVVTATARSAARATSAAPSGCNGDQRLCELRLDQVMFPATHNSMSSALYPGWLFGEQIGTISDQLDSGIRALLFDTHYGIPSAARMPGSQTPIVLTDRADEITEPGAERPLPALVARADAVAGRVPQSADAERGIYLCHNYCEMGAVSFATVLAGVEQFVTTHPDDVVLIIVQDATSPSETAQAFVDAGLEDRLATLRLGAPLPTVQDLIDAGTNLVVFAEVGGPNGPAWYQPAYQGWVQETKFSFAAVDDFDCGPNRGGTDGELFLVNHWVTTSGPDPAVARRANDEQVLGDRLERCVDQRGRLPNIVAVDYAQSSDLVSLLPDLNMHLLDRVEDQPTRTDSGVVSATTSPAAGAPTTVPASTATGSTASSIPLVVSSGDVVASLTGGDPTTFCASQHLATEAVSAYAAARLSEPITDVGTADLVYAPVLERALRVYVDAAPSELAAQATPLLERAGRAAETLSRLGLSDDDVVALADQAEGALTSDPGPDGATLETQLVATLADHVEPGDTATGAAAFWDGESDDDLYAVVDLGLVPDDVARSNGYQCLVGE